MKRIKFSALFVVLLAAFSLTSCSNDDDSKEDPIEASTGDYWPMALNNQWTLSTNGNKTTLKIIGIDDFGGIKYYKLSEGAEGAGIPEDFEYNQWIAKNGANYYEKTGDVEFSQEGISVKMGGYEMVILKDNLPVGGTWNNSVTAKAEYFFMGETIKMDYTVNYSGTILEKGISVVVNGKTYNNVIKSNLTQQVNIEGEKEVIESNYWYAEGVGPVKYTTNTDGETVETILIDYIVNN